LLVRRGSDFSAHINQYMPIRESEYFDESRNHPTRWCVSSTDRNPWVLSSEAHPTLAAEST